MNNVAIELDDASKKIMEIALAKRAGDYLCAKYPGFAWMVTVTGGVLAVRNVSLSGTWGFIVKHVDSFSATDLDKQLMRAGGEILERYRITRTALTGEQAADRVMAVTPNFAGNLAFSAEDLRMPRKAR